MLLMAVLGKVFRLFDELLEGAVVVVARERVQFEFSRRFGRADFSKLSFRGLLVLPCLLETQRDEVGDI